MGKNPKTIVTHGSPIAQKYGLGAQWREFNLDLITGDPNSPSKNVTEADGWDYYPVGPPYLATARDMHQIAIKWSEFAPKVLDEYPNLLAEMYAFCIAAAHLELPHQLATSLMVSYLPNGSDDSGEGWKLVDGVDDSELCLSTPTPPSSLRSVPLPSVLHFCQVMKLGKWAFGKRRVPHDVFSCDAPLAKEPPSDLATRYDYTIDGDGKHQKLPSVYAVKRSAFMVCTLTRALNEAALFYQEHNCAKPKNGKTVMLEP